MLPPTVDNMLNSYNLKTTFTYPKISGKWL